jgi:periplasmic protein TonB
MSTGMFANCLLETSWAHRTHRSWSTLSSFGLQGVLIVLLLLVPLWRTSILPSSPRTVSTPISMGRPESVPTQHMQSSSHSGARLMPITSQLMLPRHMPTGVFRGKDDGVEAPACPGCGSGVAGSSLGAGDGVLIPSLLSGSHPVMPVAPPPTTARVFRKSSILEGRLVRRVQPVYPQLARSARVQGPVVIFAVISKDGSIENLRVVSGHPLLAQAAKEAVNQWRYRPYILNGEPIEVETQITVNFVLGN